LWELLAHKDESPNKTAIGMAWKRIFSCLSLFATKLMKNQNKTLNS
jgi:hypothetical protein